TADPGPRARTSRPLDHLSADGVVPELDLAGRVRHRIVREAGVVRTRGDVQADGPLVEWVRNAMDAVVELPQIEAARVGAIEAAVRHQPHAVAGPRSVQALVVLEAQRALLDGDPTELARVVVDGALRPRLPAERDQLEQVVPVDEVARVAPGHP